MNLLQEKGKDIGIRCPECNWLPDVGARFYTCINKKCDVVLYDDEGNVILKNTEPQKFMATDKKPDPYFDN